MWIINAQNTKSECMLSYLLSLRGRVTEDNVDPEHLHDDGTKCKRYAKSQKPQPSYTEPRHHGFTLSRDSKQNCGNVEHHNSKHYDVELRTAQANQSVLKMVIFCSQKLIVISIFTVYFLFLKI